MGLKQWPPMVNRALELAFILLSLSKLLTMCTSTLKKCPRSGYFPVTPKGYLEFVTQKNLLKQKSFDQKKCLLFLKFS